MRDATTVRVAPQVVGEKVTWRSGPRAIVAWVGVDALDAFADLDLDPVRNGSRQSPLYKTRARPGLFVAANKTGLPAPCDVLYVSVEGLARSTARDVIDDLRVAPPTTATADGHP